MSTHRKRRSTEFKVKVALEAVKGLKTLAELASQFEVHPTQISQWKQQLLDGLPSLFGKKGNEKASKLLVDDLYRQIGQLKVECDWLKKS